MSDVLGFEVYGIPQTFTPRELVNGKLVTKDMVEYEKIAEELNGEIEPTKAVKLLDALYMFNPETSKMEEEDVVDEDMEVVVADTGDIIRFEDNVYVKNFKFDATKVDDETSSNYQPLTGLIVSNNFLTIKTHNFARAKGMPIRGDLVEYKGKFCMIEETRARSQYTPRESIVLQMALKKIN